jgi:hypothetical protein
VAAVAVVGCIGSLGGGVVAVALEEELVVVTAVETLAAAREEHWGARAGEERMGLGRYFLSRFSPAVYIPLTKKPRKLSLLMRKSGSLNCWPHT